MRRWIAVQKLKERLAGHFLGLEAIVSRSGMKNGESDWVNHQDPNFDFKTNKANTLGL